MGRAARPREPESRKEKSLKKTIMKQSASRARKDRYINRLEAMLRKSLPLEAYNTDKLTYRDKFTEKDLGLVKQKPRGPQAKKLKGATQSGGYLTVL